MTVAWALVASGLAGGAGPSAAAGAAACAVPPLGAAVAWGAGTAGQLGEPAPPAPGQQSYRDVPAEVTDLGLGTGIIQVAAGGAHGLALGADGTVWAWGDNRSGQLGDGTSTPRFRTVTGVVTTPGSTSVKAQGAAFAATDVGRPVRGPGIPAGATVAAVGGPNQLTLSAPAAGVPVAVQLGPVQLTTTSPGHSLYAATETGPGWTWVATDPVHLDGFEDGTTTFRSPSGPFSAADVGKYLVAYGVPVGTTIVSVPDAATAVLSAPARYWYQDARFSLTATAPFTDGAVDNATLTSSRATFTAADVGRYVSADDLVLGTHITQVTDAHTALLSHAVASPLTKVAFRLGPTTTDDQGRPASGPAIPEGTTVDYVAADMLHLTAPATAVAAITFTLGAKQVPVTSDGRTVPDAVATYGSTTLTSASGAFAPTDVGRSVTGPGIAAGTTVAAVVDASTVTLSVPARPTGAMTLGSTHPVSRVIGLPGRARSVAAGSRFSLAALADGTVWAWGSSPSGTGVGPTPAQVVGLDHVVEVAAGLDHALARRDTDGSVWAWGTNGLGAGSTVSQSPSPIRVQGLRPARAIAAAGDHSLAALDDGTVWGWGRNSSGVLDPGSDNPSDEWTPEQVMGVADIHTVATGDDHSLAVDGAGRVWAWGTNNAGELGLPTSTPALARGPGQVPGVTGVKAVAAGLGSSLAATTDGSLWAWGRNPSGELGRPATPDVVPPTSVQGLDYISSVAIVPSDSGQFSLAARNGGAAALAACTVSTPQVTTVGTAFAHPLAVQARDASGAPRQGVTVSFAAPVTGQSAAFGTSGPTVAVVTDAEGMAVVPAAAAGERAGAYRVTATAPGYEPSFFELTNAPGLPAVATAVAGDGQSTRITTAFPTRLAVRFTDAHDNPVATKVDFAVQPAAGAGANFSGTTQTATAATDPAGIATAPPLYANTTAGPYTVTAVVAGGPAQAEFHLANVDSVPSSLAIPDDGGDGQSAEVGQLFPAPLRVHVADVGGHGAVAATVRFRVLPDTASGAGATFVDGGGIEYTRTTSADGDASASPLRADASPGTFQVEAAVVGTAVATVRFTLLANPQPAPAVTALLPAGGPVWGGAPVVISGSGFARLAPIGEVLVGGHTATFRVLNDTAIRAVVPAGERPGSVPVRVVVEGGALRSAPSAAATFTYLGGGWVPTAPMGRARAGHTATVLDGPACAGAGRPAWCGEVLVVGGQSGGGSPPMASAEVYSEPGGVGQWSDTSPLAASARTTVATDQSIPDGPFDLVVRSTDGFPVSGKLVVNTAQGAVTIACTGATGTAFTGCDGRAGARLDAGRLVSTADAARADQSATLLADGRVLVAGGRDGTGAMASAQVYDPTSATWTPTAPMGQARFGHTATRLPDGRVLVVGGTGPGRDGMVGALLSSELFDPAGNGGRGSWTPAGALHEPRAGHSASLVAGTACATAQAPAACGKVLVAGGEGRSGFGLDTYELYDPAGSWSGGNLPAGRAHHSATALGDGRVLVAGGCCSSTLPPGDLASTEVFQPGDGSWRDAAPLAEARDGHGATLLDDGTVMVAGGSSGPGGGVPSSTEAFDPATGAWATRGSLSAPRRDPAVVALAGGRALVIGGTGDNGQPLASAELFDVRATQPAPEVTGVSPGVVAVHGASTARIAGAGFFGSHVVVHVGPVDVSGKDLIEVGDDAIELTVPDLPRGTVAVSVTRDGQNSPPTPRGRLTYTEQGWSAAASTAAVHSRHTATLIDGSACRVPQPPFACFKVLVVGGVPGPTTNLASTAAELYDPVTERWSPTAPMGVGRWGHTATLLPDGRVLVAGGVQGVNDVAEKTAELYDPTTQTWSATRPMHEPRFDHTATLLPDGGVLVAGGMTADTTYAPTAGAEVYRVDPVDLEGGSWAVTGSLDGCAPAAPDACEARGGHSANLLPDGSVLVVGGLSRACVAAACGASVALRSVERYDPRRGTWRAAAALPLDEERAFHTATKLGDGRVLVAGGVHALYSSLPTEHAGVVERTTTALLYDPGSDRWVATAPLSAARAGHTATLLGDGSVLVVGGGMPMYNVGRLAPLASSELFDPAARNGSGAWTPATPLTHARGDHTATVLDGPACRPPGPAGGQGPPAWCGAVLAVGGMGDIDFNSAVRSAELYTPGPRVRSLSPAVGSVAGGTAVDVEGSGFTGAVAVRFGDAPATSVTVRSATHLVAVAPAHAAGTVAVAVTTAAGSSASLDAQPAAAFSYQATPGRPQVSARAAGDHDVVVSWAAVAASAGDAAGPPARLYEVRESLSPIDDAASFAAATAVCAGGPSGHACVLGPAKVGDALSVAVGDLEAGTTYHYAVAAINDAGVSGPPSASAPATTTGTAPAFPAPPGTPAAAAPAGACPATPAPRPGQVRYPAGYSLLGGPAGTVVGAGSPLYGWNDAGAGGAYSSAPGTAAVVAGRGYFAWFACPRLVTLAAGGTTHLRLALGAYHASMVANPSATSAVRVSGFDYAARWDPAMDHGAGGYHLSAFRQAEVLAVGEGMWVFSYTATTVAIDG